MKLTSGDVGRDGVTALFSGRSLINLYLHVKNKCPTFHAAKHIKKSAEHLMEKSSQVFVLPT
jgi:hypothetical protein